MINDCSAHIFSSPSHPSCFGDEDARHFSKYILQLCRIFFVQSPPLRHALIVIDKVKRAHA
jgi:hypothetical protein